MKKKCTLLMMAVVMVILLIGSACSAPLRTESTAAPSPNDQGQGITKAGQATDNGSAPSTPKSAAPAFRFVVMGDSRGGTSDDISEATLRKLMEQVKKLTPQPAFVLFSGDQVKGGSVETELSDWKKIVSEYYPITSIYPSLGNHEHNEDVFSKSFEYLPNEQLAGYQRTVYSFDYGDARFIVLNSDRKTRNKYAIDSMQRAWLENKLKDLGTKRSFVMFHLPAYPTSNHTGQSLDGSPPDRDELWKIFDKYNVTAVLVGHEHLYSRRMVDSSFHPNYRNQIPQLTIGGAGAPLSKIVNDTKQVVSGPQFVFHYAVVDVLPNKTEFNVYDITNSKIDSFERK